MGPCDNHFHLVVPHPCEARALVLPEARGWTLPQYRGAQPVLWANVGHVNEAAKRLLGLEAATLYCLGVVPAANTAHVDFAYAMDPLDRAWQPPEQARWVAESDLQHLTFAHPEQRAFLRDWFARERDTSNPLTPAWYRAGWFSAAADWLREALQREDTRADGAITQVRSCNRSAVLRAPTRSANVYLKAVPRMFAHELSLTAQLAQEHAECLPAVIAADEARLWFAMGDAGDDDLGTAWQSSLPEESLRRYAQIQIEQSRSLDRWLGLGCPDHRLEQMAERIDDLFADTSAMQPDDSPVSLTHEEIGRLLSLSSPLKTLCAELAASEVPYSLEHGDLWTQQILTRGTQFSIIDWSDTTISHPFFSFCYYFADEQAIAGELAQHGCSHLDAATVCSRLRDAYLEPWTAFEPMDRLRSLLRVAGCLVGLHLALLYHECILPGIQQRWEMHRMLPHFLRRVLRATEALDGGC